MKCGWCLTHRCATCLDRQARGLPTACQCTHEPTTDSQEDE